MTKTETVLLLALLGVIACLLGGCVWYLRIINHNVMVAVLKAIS